MSAAEELAGTVAQLKAASLAQDGKIANLEQAKADLMARLTAQAQESEALKLSAQRAAADPTPAEIAYTGKAFGPIARINEGDKVDDQRRWAGSPAGVVRLLGGIEGRHWQYGYFDDPNPKNDHQIEAQERAQDIQWVKSFRKRPSQEMTKGLADHMAKAPGIIGKVFADNNGEGGEFIVTIPMTQLEQTAELERRIESLMPVLNMASNAATLPFLVTGVLPVIHGVPTSGDLNPADLSKSVPVTSDRTITATTLSVSVPVDRDAEEDSIVAARPLMQRLVAEALRDGSEDAYINGDTAATHGDTDFLNWNPRSRWQVTGADANDHRRLCIGWRQRAFDVDGTVSTATTDYNATQTVSAYIGAKAGFTTPHGFGRVVYITSPEHYLAKILTDTNLLTVDKYGLQATVVTGEVGKIGNSPLVLSEFVTADLASTGLYTGSGTTTGMVMVNMDRFLIARRRTMRIEVETVARNHTTYIVASERKTMHSYDGNTVANVRWLFNLSIA